MSMTCVPRGKHAHARTRVRVVAIPPTHTHTHIPLPARECAQFGALLLHKGRHLLALVAQAARLPATLDAMPRSYLPYAAPCAAWPLGYCLDALRAVRQRHPPVPRSPPHTHPPHLHRARTRRFATLRAASWRTTTSSTRGARRWRCHTTPGAAVSVTALPWRLLWLPRWQRQPLQQHQTARWSLCLPLSARQARTA